MSEQEIEAALTSLAFGVPVAGIAAAYHIPGPRLIEYLTPQRIAAKRAELDGRIARSLYAQAVKGENIAATIFYAKTRLRYRETDAPGGGGQTVRVTGGLPERKPDE